MTDVSPLTDELIRQSRRIKALETAVDTLKRALVDQARMLHKAEDWKRRTEEFLAAAPAAAEREAQRGRGPDSGGCS